MKPSSLHFQNPNPIFCSPMAHSALRVLRLSPFLQPLRLRHAPSELRFLSARAPRRPASAFRSARRRDDENGSVTTAASATTDNGYVSEGRVVPTELHKEATEAYMAYAMSVLLGRALPDVRDGLKPVHRRILFAMHELGLSSKKPFKKCARVVGEVLGKFHPHGDTAVYDSLVRMAQCPRILPLWWESPAWTKTVGVFSPIPRQNYMQHTLISKGKHLQARWKCWWVALTWSIWQHRNRIVFLNEAFNGSKLMDDAIFLDFSLRSPLIQGHGNFGSIDADPPAAMRYTECRLDDLTEAMLLTDLEQDTVDFVPNFDNSQKEPSLLPARLPTLLLNGSSGIAVGMATNIPPHNLGEVVDVLCVLIHNPEATLQELLEYMPGPDFPTGGLIMGNLGILEAYRTGRGRVIIRGKTDIELLDSKTKRTAIIIKEIPYQTNKATLVEKIAELVENKSLDGISDIRDESDRSGMRIVIELKRGSDPLIVLNNLYRLTSLQSTFSCNMVGILNGQPKQMGLKELLQAFLDFRCSVVERRARFKLSQAQERRHIVEGILIGFDNLDGVIRIIREASSNSAAAAGLRNAFSLSEKQAEALLDISLRRLSLRESGNFVAESKSLMEQISKLEELLSSRKNILELIEQEAIELKSKFSNPRRSMLEDTDNGQLEDIDVIPNEEMILALSEKGYMKRMKPSTFNLQNRGTIGKSVGKLKVNDSMSDFLNRNLHPLQDPTEWWKLYGVKTPHLQTIVIKVLSLTCSSSGCERNWSTFEHIHSKKRSRLEHQKLQDLFMLTLLDHFECHDVIDPIALNDTDDSNEWLLGELEGQEAGNDLMLLRQLGAGEPLKNTRSQTQINKTAAALTPTNEKGKKVVEVKEENEDEGEEEYNSNASDSDGFQEDNDLDLEEDEDSDSDYDKGTVYSARAYKIPECSRTAAGTPLVQILSLSDGERITSIIPVSEFAEDQFLLMLTMQGYIKRVSLNLFSSIRSIGIIAIQLVPGDELKWVRLCSNDDFVAMASHNGMIRTLSRNTRGAPAMRLKKGDKMASVDIIPAAMWNNLETTSKFPGINAKSQNGPWLLFVSENGYGKRVPLSSFRISSLNRVGLIGYKFSAEDRLAAVFVVGFSSAEDGESDEQVVLVSQSGTVNRIKVRDISIQSRFARGVILMRLDHSGKIQSASLISATDCEPEEVLAIAQG
ncbi:DNA gyrase subunit A, chloroplastic/mitochondrial [Glycine max]|nr:DNA gyrase subunit A, chloroplastic/mitochondrial [Glycine max]